MSSNPVHSLIIPASVYTDLSKAKATSAAPGLDPLKRFVRDKVTFDHFKTRQITKQGFDEQREAGAFKDGDIDMKDSLAQVGKAMKSDEIQKRLETLNHSLMFEVSKADEGKVGVYIQDWTAKEKRRFICGMERGWTPEWTITQYQYESRLVESHPPKYETFKKYVSEKRGWRKVLATLIRAKHISRHGANKVFGIPADRQRWNQYLKGYE